MPLSHEFNLATQPKQAVCERQQLLQEEELPSYAVELQGDGSQTHGSDVIPRHRGGPRMVAWCFRIIFVTLLMTLGFIGGCAFERHKRPSYPGGSPDITPDAIHDLVHSDARKPYIKTTQASFLSPATAFWQDNQGPEMDELFQRSSSGSIFLITEQDMRRLGKDPGKHVRIPDSWGYGDRVFLTKFDHSHELHCVNMLRMLIHKEHYGLLAPNHTAHGDHCVLVLYDYLSCHTSTDLLNFVWVEGRPWYEPDFEVARQCRDPEPLYDFLHEHDVTADARIRYLVASPGDYVVPHDTSPDGLPYAEEARTRRESFEAAMEAWEATGEIPRA